MFTVSTRYDYRLMWTASKVRQVCKDNEYYADGSEEDYNKMLRYVGDYDTPDEDDIIHVAIDIIAHSDKETRKGLTTDAVISNLINDACSIIVM